MTIELRQLQDNELEQFRHENIKTMVAALSQIKRTGAESVQQFCEQQLNKEIEESKQSSNEFIMGIVDSTTQTLVGSLWYRLHEEIIYSDLAFIAWLGIYEPYRRKGFAKKALTELATLLKKQGIHRFALQAYNNNSTSMNFYENCGFTPKRTLFHKYLD